MTAIDGRRIERLLARFIGVGFVGFFLVSLPELDRTASLVAAWWTPIAVGLVFIPGIGLFMSTFGVGQRWMPGAATAAAGGYLLANLLWLPAWNGLTLNGLHSRSNWLVMFAGLAGLSAALVLRAWAAMAVQVAASVLSATTDQMGLAGGQALPARIAYEAAWSVAVSGVFVAAVLVGLATARDLDRTRAVVAGQAAAAAAREARTQERARFDALIHDQILAVLLETHRGPVTDRTRDHARVALRELDSTLAGATDEGWVGASAVRDRLATVAAQIDDHLVISATTAPDCGSYPPHAIAEITNAMAEALRNSVLHAGDDAHRALTVSVAPDAVDVVVTDLGVGFDPARTGGRLGIAMSITERMRRLDGGSSRVRSRPGAGTVVEIRWQR